MDGLQGSTSYSDRLSGPPERRTPEPAPRRAPQESPQADLNKIVEGYTSDEVLRKVAERARELPPPKDVLQLTMAAARYTLTNLESARVIARQVREEIDQRADETRAAERATFDAIERDPDREEIARSLAG